MNAYHAYHIYKYLGIKYLELKKAARAFPTPNSLLLYIHNHSATNVYIYMYI
jgi:hypothetical protein